MGILIKATWLARNKNRNIKLELTEFYVFLGLRAFILTPITSRETHRFFPSFHCLISSSKHEVPKLAISLPFLTFIAVSFVY